MLLEGCMLAEEMLPMETTGEEEEVVVVVREELTMATVDTALVVEVVEGLSKEDTEGGKEAATDVKETGAFGGGKKAPLVRGSDRTGPAALPTI